MRKELRKLNEERRKFKGTFAKYSWKNGYKYPEKTILLKNIIDSSTGKEISDHLWFNFTKGFEEANLIEGCAIEFEARVKEYWKGYKGRREDVYTGMEKDYRLSHPTKIKNLGTEVMICETISADSLTEAKEKNIGSPMKNYWETNTGKT